MSAYTVGASGLARRSPAKVERQRFVAAIILATLTFNFILCFVNTNVTRVGASGVILGELLLIGSALLAIIDRSRDVVVLLATYVAYCVFLCALQGVFDPKPIRDIVIAIVFYFVGREQGSPRWGDRIVTIAVAVVLAVGLFEYFMLPLYIRLFDILGYYVSRGSVPAVTAEFASDRLFISGMRFEGRTLLPFLGEHRVSSIFLEPVSVGNFGAICFAWITLRNWGRPLAAFWRLLPVVAIFVFADARFGLFVSLASIPLYAMARRIHWIFLLIAPFTVIVALAFIGYLYPDVAWDNTLKGRLLLSGQMLASLTPSEVFALVRVDRFTSDSGYTYTLSQIGLVGFGALWGLFVIAPCRDLASWRFKVFAAVYFVLLLTISNSIYSIKTAALIWYLLGALANTPDGRVDRFGPLGATR